MSPHCLAKCDFQKVAPTGQNTVKLLRQQYEYEGKNY